MLAAGFLLWLSTLLRRYLPTLKGAAAKRTETVKQKKLAGSEEGYRQEIIHIAKKRHLAQKLFPIDEILIEPRLMIPPANAGASETSTNEYLSTQMVPYLPDLPEFAARFNFPTMSITEALQNGADIAILGAPGQGKTVALAYFASLVASRDPKAGKFAAILPIFFHAADLKLDAEQGIPFTELILGAVATQSPYFAQNGVQQMLRKSISSGDVLFLIDGLDELQPTLLEQTVTLITTLKKETPTAQFIVAASGDYTDGLISHTFEPVSLAAWTQSQYKEFVMKWSQAWKALMSQVDAKVYADDKEIVQLINCWLNNEVKFDSPIEWTLKVWGAFSGDLFGPTCVDALDAYFNRIFEGEVPIEAAAPLGLEMAAQRVLSVDLNQAEKWIIGQTTGPAALVMDSDNNGPKTQQEKVATTKAKCDKILRAFFENGIAYSFPDNTIRFTSPLFPAYFASLSDEAPQIQPYPDLLHWEFDKSVLFFLVARSKPGPWIQQLLEIEDPPLYRNILTISRWLKEAPLDANWRSLLMRSMVQLLEKEKLPVGVRAKFIIACAQSRDPSVAILFKQLASSPSSNLRQLAALGLGLMGDQKSIATLANLITDPVIEVRCSACFSLSTFGNATALQLLAEALMTGDEHLRQSAAEALASVPGEGQEIIKNAASYNDILVRRASVIGLGRVKEPWSKALLEKITVEDSQWVVRNAALQALEGLQNPNANALHPLKKLSECDWLIKFAEQHGTSITSDALPVSILLQILKSGTPEEKMAALPYGRYVADESATPAIYSLFYSEQSAIKEAAAITLWYIAISGVKLPNPDRDGFA
jgi:hypothetical protein